MGFQRENLNLEIIQETDHYKQIPCYPVHFSSPNIYSILTSYEYVHRREVRGIDASVHTFISACELVASFLHCKAAAVPIMLEE